MISYIVLVIVMLIFALVTWLLIESVAALFILAFGDLIVWLFETLFKKKNKKN